MANPESKHGHTPVPHRLIESLAKIRISGEESRCLCVIIRQTYGWHKTQDAIALVTFAKSTGIRKPNVVRALRKLAEKKIITIIKNDNGNGNVYGINQDYAFWQPLSPKRTVSGKITGVIGRDNEALSRARPSKDKEKITEKDKTVSADALRLADLLLKEILDHHPKSRFHTLNDTERTKTLHAWSREIGLLITKDGQGPSTIEEVIDFAMHDDFWAANILEARKLRRHWDILVAQKERKGGRGDERTARHLDREDHGDDPYEGFGRTIKV